MESLPEELLLQIFEIVSTQIWQTKGLYSTNYLRRTRNLQRLSLVSRRFHRIVIPLLYESIVGPIFLSVPFWSCIVRTAHQNPDLAQLIKRFSMTKPNPPFHNSPPQSLRSELSIALLSELYSYDGFLPEVALLDLEHRSKRRDYILMAFLILKAPALKELHLTGFEAICGTRSPTRLPLLIEEMGFRIYRDIDAGRSPRCFEHLCSLRIELDEWGYFPADAVIPLLYLPRLRSLKLEGWGLQTKRRKRSGFRLYGPGRKWPVRSSSIEELTIDCNNTTVKQVESLLLSCAALRRIEISTSQANQDRLEAMEKNIFNCILNHAESLDTIIIEHSRVFAGFYPSAFRQLSLLKSMRYLQIPYCMILGEDSMEDVTGYLPSSLEYLVLGFSQETMGVTEIEANIGKLSETIPDACIRQSLPHLKAVEITLQWYRYMDQSIFPIPDVRHTIAKLKKLQVIFGLSMTVKYHNEKPPTVENMQILKRLFPGVHVWCKGHKVLRLSTSTEPCVPGYKPKGFWQPYGWVWKPWDFENDPNPADE